MLCAVLHSNLLIFGSCWRRWSCMCCGDSGSIHPCSFLHHVSAAIPNMFSVRKASCDLEQQVSKLSGKQYFAYGSSHLLAKLRLTGETKRSPSPPTEGAKPGWPIVQCAGGQPRYQCCLWTLMMHLHNLNLQTFSDVYDTH